MATRTPPPAFKATIRTPTMIMEVKTGSIVGGIVDCFYMVGDKAQRERLLAKLQEHHQKMTDNEEQRAATAPNPA